MYKETPAYNGVIRLADHAHIPFDAGNADYLAYVEWRNAGNLPLPPDAPSQREIINAAIDRIERATGVVRVVREGMLLFAEDKAERDAAAKTAAGTPTTAAELLAKNPGYMRTKAVDDQIAQLRAQLV